MRQLSKYLLATLSILALLALAVAGASARNFSFTEKNFELIWNNALTNKTKWSFRTEGGHSIECNVTMLGRYPSNTIAKRTEVNQGTINHGEVEGCTGGTLTIKTETMPWGMRYRSFTGTLPAIGTISIGIIGEQWRLTEGGLTCEFVTEANHPAVYISEGSGLENIRADETNTIPLNGIICAFTSPASFAGRGLSLNLPRTAKITVTLI